MKKSFMICAVFSALLGLPVQHLNAQVVASVPILEVFFENSQALNMVQYIAMAENTASQVKNTISQIEMMIKQEEMALNNLKSITNVKNFGDFMKWYNRQAYLEQQAENRFKSMGVKIGNKTYTYKQITEIPNAAINEFDPNNTFGRNLSESERREVYMKLGMSPQAYAYTRVWEERDKKLIEMAITAQESKAKENEEMAKGHEELVNKYKDDANKSETEKMSEKALQMDANILSMETNRELGKLNEQIALQNEMTAINDLQKGAPDSAVTIQEWNKSSFSPVVEVSVEEEED